MASASASCSFTGVPAPSLGLGKKEMMVSLRLRVFSIPSVLDTKVSDMSVNGELSPFT